MSFLTPFLNCLGNVIIYECFLMYITREGYLLTCFPFISAFVGEISTIAPSTPNLSTNPSQSSSKSKQAHLAISKQAQVAISKQAQVSISQQSKDQRRQQGKEYSKEQSREASSRRKYAETTKRENKQK